MIQFNNLEVFQTEPITTVVVWTFRLTNEDLTGLVVTVDRSYSPTDGFEKVGEAVYPQRYLRDSSPGLHDYWRKAYYRISATFQGHTLEYGPVTTNSTLSVIAKEMIRRKNIELKFNGIPLLIYLKRKGERCTACWDEFLKKATRSTCPVCFGTSYEGGYYEPILTLGNLIPEDKTDQPDVTKRQDSQTSVSMSVVPVLRPQDVIYEVNNGISWRVTRITPVEIDRQLVGQEPVMLTKLNPGDVEHELPIPEGLDYLITPHWNHHIKKPFDKVVHRENESADPVEKMDLWR